MIGFNTMLSLPTKTSEIRFLEICRKWQKFSPHSTLTISDEEIVDGLKYQSDSESLEFVRVSTEKGVHCGVRHIKKDDDGEWRTDVVGYKTEANFTVAIVSSRAAFNIASYWNLPQKPYIVKLLLEEIGSISDGEIEVEAKPKEVTIENYHKLVSVINGETKHFLPVVYISRYFFGDSYLVDPQRLAVKLSGLAHVFYETDTIVSTKLKEITNGRNPYNGKIGIFWPNGECNYYYYREYQSDHIKNILDFVKKTLNTRKTLNECRWSFVQGLKYQSILENYKKGEDEQQKFINYVLEEYQILKDQIEALEAENRYLNQLKETFYSNDFSGKTPLCYKGSEPELFPNEQLEIIYEIIEDRLRNGNCSPRVKNILHAILDANEKTNNREKFLGEVRRLLASSNGLTKKSIKELISLGFEITEEGKHYKMRIRGDDRYSHSISKTPSDHRAALNNFSEFKERFINV
jgi:hypothetical protein